MRLARVVRAVALASVALVATADVACSLGLDPSLIEAGAQADGGTVAHEAGADAPAHPDGDAHAAQGEGAAPAPQGACSKDSDCQSAAEAGTGCVTAYKCDPTWHVCMLTTCAVAGCKAAVCDVAQQSCSVPTTYGFETTQFPVKYGGVGAGVRFSIAAAWPFVFVVTTNGVVAFDVVDPTSSSPPQVTVHGVPFIPIATVAVGRRVFFTGGTQGGGPTYRQAVAWVDVPQNPLLTDLYATSAFVGTPDTGISNVLTNGVDGMYVVYGSQTFSPTAVVQAPLDETTTLQPFANAGMPQGSGIAAASGSRLVTYRFDASSGTPYLALVTGAATAGAQAGNEAALDAYGPLAGQAMLATGDDGSLLWTSAIDDLNDAGNADGVATARLTWLLDSATSTTFATTAHVDLESYSPPTGALVVGPPLWIDANTALGLAAASSGSTSSTSVQRVTKSPPAVDSSTRTLLSAAPDAVGAAASNGFAYVLAQDDPKNQSCSVYVFAPSCGGGD